MILSRWAVNEASHEQLEFGIVWSAVEMPRGTVRESRMVMYEKPSIVDFGTLTQLTAAQAAGRVTDRDFPSGTPVDEPTFSG
jgi:hypothetical protein